MKILNNLSTPHPLKNKKTIFLLYISCIFLFNFITLSCGSSSENNTTTPPTTPVPEPDLDLDDDGVNDIDDVDDDDNGLIEIRTLEQLNMIRNDLTGASLHDGTVGVSTGCPTSGCNGYELVNSLRFDSGDDFDTTGAGNFLPIGDNSTNSGSSRFTATFDGNGHTIINLNIQSNSLFIGLFGYVGSSGTIRNIGLVDNTSNYTGTSDSANYVGGLVGRNYGGTIIASYSTGDANGGTGNSDIVGGLVGENDSSTIVASYTTGNADGGTGDFGRVGGLVGTNIGTIVASYSTGNADGRMGTGDYVGGLVGYNLRIITSSYSTGDADGGTGDFDRVGGLLGRNDSTIVASYSTGNADGGGGAGDYVGELVGQNFSGGAITASYGFGSTLEVDTAGDDGTSKPNIEGSSTPITMASQLVSANAGVAWNEAARNTLNAWSFGSGAPKLKYADYDGTSATYNCDMFPASVTCGTTLIPGQ